MFGRAQCEAMLRVTRGLLLRIRLDSRSEHSRVMNCAEYPRQYLNGCEVGVRNVHSTTNRDVIINASVVINKFNACNLPKTRSARQDLRRPT